jgi:predicted TIM-barrel fold metal-dependent hydrolase
MIFCIFLPFPKEPAPLSLVSLNADAEDLRTGLLELRDEVRRDHQQSLVAHVAHSETDDLVYNTRQEHHLKLAGFRPTVTGLSGEALYASIRDQICAFLKGVLPLQEFKVV